MNRFAVFDIDGTLLRWQFFHAIVNELGKEGVLNEDEHFKIKQARMRWKTRTSNDSFHDYENVLVNIYKQALPKINESTHNKAADTVYKEYKNQLFTYTRDLIKSLKQKGYFLIAISGSHSYIVEKFCQDLNIDDFVAAETVIKDGHYSGDIKTPIINKAEALKIIVSKNNLSFKGSYGVGDSSSDAAMLDLVEHPIAFNPDQKLFRIAKAKKWQIVIERKNVVYKLKSDSGLFYLKEE